MKKVVFALLALLLSAGTARAGGAITPSGIPSYSYFRLLEEFNRNEYAIKSALQGKLVRVSGTIDSVKEGEYDPLSLNGTACPAPVVTFTRQGTLGSFIGYLFDDPVDPAVLSVGSFTFLLCEDVQKDLSGVNLQGKCKVVESLGKPGYQNKELRAILETYPRGVRMYSNVELFENFNDDPAAFKDKLVVVTSPIRDVKEETYFPNSSDLTGNQGKVPVVSLTVVENSGNFVGYLFDDPVNTSMLKNEYEEVGLLCGEIQQSSGGLLLQGKCKVLFAGSWDNIMNNTWEYRNEELLEWLNTPAD